MRRGRFEQAEAARCSSTKSATCPAELQTRLLRVLSDGNFYRVGGHQPIKANVRVIAATHQNMEDRVRQGLFREDLFHRLNVIRLRLPPLRERREDIPSLAKHFISLSAQGTGVEAKRLPTEPEIPAEPGFPRQRAPARKPLPLAHRDGPGPDGRSGRPAARTEGPAHPRTARQLGRRADGRGRSGHRPAPGEVFDMLSRDFERILIRRALSATGGRGSRRATPGHRAQHHYPQDPGTGLEEPDHA